jgi:NAD-dependent deacetylase
MPTIELDDDARLLVLTGAGVSAESGVPTFRGMNGLWEGHRVEEVASPEGFAADPLLVWRFYSMRREALVAGGIAPNPAHRALAAVEQRLGDRFLLVSQNVDGLHRAAGSERLIDLHGDLMRTRCTVCDRPPFQDRVVYRAGVAPMCGRCQAKGRDALLRPDIVWFGELIDPDALRRIQAFAGEAGQRLVFLAVGTSGNVYPAAGLVDAARRVGGRSYLVNADPPENVEQFDRVVLGKAGELLPGLLQVTV